MKSVYGAWRRLVQQSLLLFFISGALVPSFAATTATAAPAKTLLVLGDSLSAGYGLAASHGWVALTAQRMRASHPGWRLVNASISGETTAGGASRIAAELKRSHPDVVVLELGANDGLRGLDLAQTRINLEKIIRACEVAKARVLLVGMRMPPNFGQQYTHAFEQIYAELAKSHRLELVPFLLAPVAGHRDAFQADNMHPTAAAQPKLRDHVWTALQSLLK